jgi:hypothetical protein
MAPTTTSGSQAVSTSEVVLKEYSSVAERFVDFTIDLTPMASGDTFKIRVYKKNASAGSYVLFANDSFTDAQAIPLVYYPLMSGKFGIKCCMIKTAGTDRTFAWESVEVT